MKQEIDKVSLWHTADELKEANAYSIVFITRRDWNFKEASYYGMDFSTGEPKYLYNNLDLNLRDVWIWCRREDIFKMTNLNEVIDLLEEKEKTK